jgi:type I restriction enzyme S subunit
VTECSEFTFSQLISSGVLEIGDGYRAKISELGGDGPIFLRAGHVTDTHIDFAGVDRFHSNKTSALTAKMSRPGDVIVTTKGNSTGRVAFVDSTMPSFVYSPHLSYWRSLDQERLVPGFLRYWSQSPHFRSQLAGLAGSTDMALYLSLIDQRRLRIVLPPSGEQKAISRVLSSLDDKIELNRRMNETLEAIARAIFKSWFVNFDPVSTKAEGRQPYGLDVDIAALFSDSFEDSSLGTIPSSWQPTKLSSEADCVKGVSYRSSELEQSNVALVTLKSVARGGGYREDGVKPYSGKFKSNQVVVQGEVVVAHTDVTQAAEVLGRAARVRTDPRYSQLIASLDLVIVRPKNDRTITAEFLYGLLSRDEFRDYAYGQSNGTTVIHLSHKALPDYVFLLPPTPIVMAFTEVVRPLFQQIDSNFAQCRTLAAARDALLPKLVSGRIQLQDAESLIKADV